MNQLNQDQINIGNETALDLLVKQNNAKQELANNLQGLGVNANASTDTLEQLAYKVSTVSVDNNKQKPKCLALKIENDVQSGEDWKYCDGIIIKNGWFFYRYYNGSDQLRGAKLSNLNISDYSINKSVSKSYGNIGSYSYSNSYPSLVFNEDGSHLYVMCDNSVRRYNVSGYDGNTISLSSLTTYTPNNEGNSIEFYNIDISTDETTMSIVDRNGNFYVMDLTGSATPDLPIIDNDKDIMKFRGSSNTEFISFTVRDNGNPYYLDITPYSLNNGTLLSGTSITFNYATLNYWQRGIVKYKDSNNNYKFIVHLGGYNRAIPGFVVVDSTTFNYTKVYSKINYFSDATAIAKPIITVVDNNYYIIAAMALAIFNSNWDLIGNVINQKNNSYYFNHSFIFDNTLYDVGEDNGTIYFMKHKTWFNKLVAYQRTVDTDYYVPYYADWTENGIINGYFDE